MKKSFKGWEKNEAKTAINKAFAKRGNKKGVSIVLDGPKCLTRKALLEAGWKRKSIHIPNCSKDYNAVAHNHKQTYEMTLGEFLELHITRQQTIGSIYMDYMCTLDSNDDCRPMEDLKKVFVNKLLKPGAVIGVTLSVARGKKNDTPFLYPDSLKLITTITRLAQEAGYTATLVEEVGGPYHNGGNMFTYLFEV